MGAKTWMLVIAQDNARAALAANPQIDRAATQELAHALFPGERLEAIEDGDLSYTNPPDDELYIGCFPGVSVIAASEFGIDSPSALPQRFIDAGGSGTVTLHAMHSVVDWFAYAVWKDGKLLRALSLSPDSGIIEDIGQRLPFEEPYWSGKHPAVDGDDEDDSYPFSFHPLELGEAALNDQFGYQIEGYFDAAMLEAESIPLLRYKRSPALSSAPTRTTSPWWKFW